MTQNKAVRIVSLTAFAQQILIQALCQMELTSVHVIARLPIGYVKALRGRTQLLPQLSCSGIRSAHLRSGITFGLAQDGTQGSVKFELLSVTSGGFRQ